VTRRDPRQRSVLHQADRCGGPIHGPLPAERPIRDLPGQSRREVQRRDPEGTRRGTGRSCCSRRSAPASFAVSEFDPSRKLTLKKHADYWAAAEALLDEIVFQAIPDESRSWRLRTGTDRDGRVRLGAELSGGPGRGVPRHGAGPVHALGVLDLAGDQEPTGKPEVRQAIELAIDRQAICRCRRGLGAAPGRAAAGMKSWAVPWQELPNQQRDVAKAKGLLQKAAYSGRVAMKIRNIVGFPALAASLPVIVDNLKEAGIDVTVETVDGGVWIKDWIVPQSPSTMNELGGFIDPDQASTGISARRRPARTSAAGRARRGTSSSTPAARRPIGRSASRSTIRYSG